MASQADARDFGALKAAVDDGVAELGRLDIVSANAGLFGFSTLEDGRDPAGHRRRRPDGRVAQGQGGHLALAADGGSVILTSSAVGLKTIPDTGHCNSAETEWSGACARWH